MSERNFVGFDGPTSTFKYTLYVPFALMQIIMPHFTFKTQTQYQIAATISS